MKGHCFSNAIILIPAMLLMLGDAVPTTAPAPREVLKSKGLIKVNSFYILDGDAHIPDWLKALHEKQKRIEDAQRRRKNLQSDVDAAYATLDNLDAKNKDLIVKLDATSKDAFGTYNWYVDQVNDVRAKIREGLDFVQKRQAAIAAIDDPTDEYVNMVLQYTDMMEALNTQYQVLGSGVFDVKDSRPPDPFQAF